MNYRHAYHAGNFSEVFKHVLLISLISAFLRKNKPFCYLETHAGLGSYDLFSEAAQKTQEYTGGIAKVYQLHDPRMPESIVDYIEMVRSWNQQKDSSQLHYLQRSPVNSRDGGLSGGGSAILPLDSKQNSVLRSDYYQKGVHGDFRRELLHYYPGSPRFVRSLLRPQDRMILTELHPEDVLILKDEFHKDSQVAVHHLDGYLGLKAFLPPKEGRGLVFIDPAFEKEDEFKRIAQQLQFATQRWSAGTFAVWYPIKDAVKVKNFYQFLKSSGIREILCCELHVPFSASTGLFACGMIVVRPPWQWKEQVEQTLPWMCKILSEPGQGSYFIDWLVQE